MAADEEIAGHEIGGQEPSGPNPVMPPTQDDADYTDAYGEVEYAGSDINPDLIIPEDAYTIEGDTDEAYGEIEYAGKDVNPNAIFQSLPTSNVEEFNTSTGRLGCGVPTVFITSRCSSSMTCQLELSDITKLTWTRMLDDVSTAEVVIGLTGDASQTCCQCLATVEPWCHELHIWRDGDEVWVGPIQAVRYEREQVTLYARDSLAWLDVRFLEDGADFANAPTPGQHGPESDLTTIATFVLDTAFAPDIAVGNTCEIDQIYAVPTGEVIRYVVERFTETAGEMFKALADGTKLNFTVLGRSIILMADSLSLTPLGLLNDDHIMGEIEVTKDGALQGNKYWVHYEGDLGFPGVYEVPPSDRYCYSVIERMVQADGIGVVEDANATAQSFTENSFIAPKILVVPEGSKLSPDTPWTINQMVPGARVDVAITRLCLEMTQSFLLTGINVEYSEQEGELIGISLSPMNSVAGG